MSSPLRDADEQPSLESLASTALPCDHLFAVASEPVILVKVGAGLIVAANPPVGALLEVPPRELTGAPLPSHFRASDRAGIVHTMSAARQGGSAALAPVRARAGAVDLDLRLSLVRGGADQYLLARLNRSASRAVAGGAPGAVSNTFRAVDSSGVPFAIATKDFKLAYANRPFVELVGAGSRAAVDGRPLGTWLRLSPRDLAGLEEAWAHRVAATAISASLAPSVGPANLVELNWVPVPDGGSPCWGITLRRLARPN